MFTTLNIVDLKHDTDSDTGDENIQRVLPITIRAKTGTTVIEYANPHSMSSTSSQDCPNTDNVASDMRPIDTTDTEVEIQRAREQRDSASLSNTQKEKVFGSKTQRYARPKQKPTTEGT